MRELKDSISSLLAEEDNTASGDVRSRVGKVKGGHENEVFWSEGGDKLNFNKKGSGRSLKNYIALTGCQ